MEGLEAAAFEGVQEAVPCAVAMRAQEEVQVAEPSLPDAFSAAEEEAEEETWVASCQQQVGVAVVAL